MGVEAGLIAAGVGLGAISAISQAKAGQQQAKEVTRQADYNSQVYDQQAQMVLEKKKIDDAQYLRNKKRVSGSIIAGAAGKGFQFSGSPLAVLVDSETQMGFDKSITDYNSDVQRNAYSSAAVETRYAGGQQSALAKATGNANAFSTILNTAFMAGKL